MPNPMMNESLFAPADGRHGGVAGFGVETLGQRPTEPVTLGDGRYGPHDVTTAPARTMTIGGTASAAGLMLVVLAVGGWFGWGKVVTEQVVVAGRTQLVAQLPNSVWLWAPIIVALGFALVTAFRPRVAPFTSLGYALAEGVALGVISHLYEVRTSGIVVQAILATAGVFLAMLALYGLRILRATPRFVKGVVAATFGIMAMYLVGFVVSLFGGSGLSFWSSPSPLGILISVVIVIVAALNLIIDFDMIERGARTGAPAYMEWYGAFALIVTLVWLYLELLRLLSKLQSR